MSSALLGLSVLNEAMLFLVLASIISADAAVFRSQTGLLHVQADASKSNVTGAPRYGSAGCSCIGIDKLEGQTTATLKDGSKVPYPADLGAHCEAWDSHKHPKCPGESWCESKWCYVDPCKCEGLSTAPKPSNYLPDAKYQGKPVYFSYATCGGEDTFTGSYKSSAEAAEVLMGGNTEEEDIEELCEDDNDGINLPAKWGDDSCRCVGIGPQPGTTNVTIKGKPVAFPADTGATCQAWEEKNHPDCSGKAAPSWCSQKWCYVDPCSCKLATPPKTSSYLPDANYQGRPVYYSYATCGGSDSYTAGRKEACVNQSRGRCAHMKKCAWNGNECLGKELVEVCHSGSWTPKAIVVLVLSLFVLTV